MKKIAISVGDLNGIGLELILKNHSKISKICKPIYCISKTMLVQGSSLLNISIDKNMSLCEDNLNDFTIEPSCISAQSGEYSFNSFKSAISLVQNNKADSVMTLPIHKKAWQLGEVDFKGHTDYLSHIFKQKGIMMLGCEKMYVGLFSDHIPLKDVPKIIDTKQLVSFLLRFQKSTKAKKIAVLGVNPHAGDNGVLGSEDEKIKEAITLSNSKIGEKIFSDIQIPDVAFSPKNRKKYKYFIAMYHDQGLIALKSLYFDESINVTLDLPIKRASVDHGCAFDIAYKNEDISSTSYLNAIKYLIKG